MKVTKMKNAIVLLHGAGLGSWIWEGVGKLLGHNFLAIDLPGRVAGANLADTSPKQLTEHVLGNIEASGIQNAILVGHSATGPLALACASERPELVKSVVLIGAAVAPTGRSYADSLPLVPRLFLKILGRLFRKGLLAPANIAKKALCNDLSEELATGVVERMVPEAGALFLGAFDWQQPARALYIKLLDDKSDLGPQLQDQMSERLTNARVKSIPGGHLAMISQPKLVAELLDQEAGSVFRHQPVGST